MSLKVLTTGFANSGTSFITELVACLGYWPGAYSNLKEADDHNPYGYWEHLPLRSAVWGTVGYFREREIPKQPHVLPPNSAVPSMIRDIAEQDRVEVYKEITLPWSYPLFPDVPRAILIRRRPDTLYERYYGPDGWAYKDFLGVYMHYHDLAAAYLDDALVMLWINYEDFLESPGEALACVCAHLGKPYDRRALSVFRPRKPQ